MVGDSFNVIRSRGAIKNGWLEIRQWWRGVRGVMTVDVYVLYVGQQRHNWDV